MTNAEVLQDWGRAELDLLRGRLRARAAELREEVRRDLLKADDDRARALADRVNDLEDDSVVDLIVDLDLFDIDRDLHEWREVEAALARMRQGTYGVCPDCDQRIAWPRLDAWPTAVRCTRCQDLHERTHAHAGTPSL